MRGVSWGGDLYVTERGWAYSTAAQVLSDLIRRCHADDVAFAITRTLVHPRPRRGGAVRHIDELLGPGRMFRSVEEAIRAARGEASPREAQSGSCMVGHSLSWHEPPRYWYCAVICGRFTCNSHGRR
jgi:hypothetical protein